MTREVLYRYLGTNGVIESPVHLEDIYYTRINILTAKDGCVLYNGARRAKQIRCSDDEVAQWKEVAMQGQK